MTELRIPLLRAGNLSSKTGHGASGFEYCKEAVDLSFRLRSLVGDSAENVRMTAISLSTAAGVLFANGRDQEALPLLKSARDIFMSLVGEHRLGRSIFRDIATIYFKLAVVEIPLQREHLRRATEMLDILRDRGWETPNDLNLRKEIGALYSTEESTPECAS